MSSGGRARDIPSLNQDLLDRMDWDRRLEEARAKREVVLRERAEKAAAETAGGPSPIDAADKTANDDPPWALTPEERAVLFQGSILSPFAAEQTDAPAHVSQKRTHRKAGEEREFALNVASAMSAASKDPKPVTRDDADLVTVIGNMIDNGEGSPEDQGYQKRSDDQTADVIPLVAGNVAPARRRSAAQIGLAFCAGIAVGGVVMAAQLFLPDQGAETTGNAAVLDSGPEAAVSVASNRPDASPAVVGAPVPTAPQDVTTALPAVSFELEDATFEASAGFDGTRFAATVTPRGVPTLGTIPVLASAEVSVEVEASPVSFAALVPTAPQDVTTVLPAVAFALEDATFEASARFDGTRFAAPVTRRGVPSLGAIPDLASAEVSVTLETVPQAGDMPEISTVLARPGTPTASEAITSVDLGRTFAPAPIWTEFAGLNNMEPRMAPVLVNASFDVPSPGVIESLVEPASAAGLFDVFAVSTGTNWSRPRAFGPLQASLQPEPDIAPPLVQETVPVLSPTELMRLRVLARLRDNG